MGRGLARIAEVLWGKAPCSAGIACPPPRTPRRGAARRGRKWRERPPLFRRWCATGAGTGGRPGGTRFPPPCGEVAPSTVIPGGKAIERCRGQGRSTDRFCPSTPAGQVAGPVIHEPASALEQVRAPVGCLDPAADLVACSRSGYRVVSMLQPCPSRLPALWSAVLRGPHRWGRAAGNGR